MPAAKTGNDNNNNTAVINTAQTNKGTKPILKPGDLILITVAIKLIAPKIDDIPAICKLKIAISTEPSDAIADNGGYTVQPVPGPAPIILDNNNKLKEGGNNQKLKLFKRGKAISGAPNIKGKNQLPKPPIIAGITIKKIIINACAVITTL
jgi:hypothetical protein